MRWRCRQICDGEMLGIATANSLVGRANFRKHYLRPMSSQPTTRVLFQQEIGTALGVSEQDLRAKYNDPAISLQIIEPEKVSLVVAPWPDILNWEYAKKRATIFHRSCFVGVSTGASANIAALALGDCQRSCRVTSCKLL
jgi:hypothetical protein